MNLSNEDIPDVVKILVDLRNGRAKSMTSTTWVTAACAAWANWLKTSTAAVSPASKGRQGTRLGQAGDRSLMPHDLINSKPISAALKEFFGASQLSQFMRPDQPAVRDHAQASCLGPGPGGLTRERAGFSKSVTHPTHYGRVCPIETPEGRTSA